MEVNTYEIGPGADLRGANLEKKEKTQVSPVEPAH